MRRLSIYGGDVGAIAHVRRRAGDHAHLPDRPTRMSDGPVTRAHGGLLEG